jgi:hypothetical protein
VKKRRWTLSDVTANLRKAGWNCGCISSTDHKGRQFWGVAAERKDDGRFIVRANEVLTAFLELHAAIQRQREVGISLPLQIFNPNPTIL